MIFVSVGTSKYPFPRLIRTVDELAPELDERVFVQAGSTLSECSPRNVEYTDYVSREEYERLTAESDLVVTHAGTGSIITALRNDAAVLLFPRRTDRGEHIDDQQLETAAGWEDRASVPVAHTTDELRERLLAGDVQPPSYEGESALREVVGDLLAERAAETEGELTVFCPSPPGGHLTQLRQLADVLDQYDTRYLTWDEEITGSIDGVELVDGYHVEELPDPGTIRNFLVSKLQIARLLVRHRPSIVISTGGGDFVFYAAYLAKLLGAQVVHVESMTRFDSASTTGKILYPIADRFFVQHPDVLESYGDRAEYRGTLF